MCAVQFCKDEGWYRGRVDRILENKKVQVFYVDYGNTEIVDSDEIRMLMPKFRVVPPQVGTQL